MITDLDKAMAVLEFLKVPHAIKKDIDDSEGGDTAIQFGCVDWRYQDGKFVGVYDNEYQNWHHWRE